MTASFKPRIFALCGVADSVSIKPKIFTAYTEADTAKIKAKIYASYEVIDNAKITPKIFATRKQLDNVTIKPKVFAEYKPAETAKIKPRIFASYSEADTVTIKPHIFASYADADIVKITPKIFASYAEANSSKIKPRIFAAYKIADSASIKPKIFASYEAVDSFVNLKPRIFASFIPYDGGKGEQVTVIADTLIQFGEIDTATADTLRIINRREKITADTLMRVPHNLVYYVNETPPLKAKRLKAAVAAQSLVSTFADYGISNFSVTLSERTLSDTFSLETARAMDILDAVKGQLLDYPFSFLVEETSQQDLIQSVRGMYDVDKLLYTLINFSNAPDWEDHGGIDHGGVHEDGTVTDATTAGGYISQIAHYLGLTPNIKIQDFTPYHDFSGSNITYSDLLNTLFSWTSRLPQRQINIFIRGGVLHCIQRGMEDSVFDITDLPHSRPTVNKKLIRSLWNNPKANYNDSDNDDDKDDDDNPLKDYGEEIEVAKPFSGTISYSDSESAVSLRYSRGVIKEENHSDGGKTSSKSRTTYEYIEIFQEFTSELSIWLHDLIGDYYLSKKETEATTYIEGETATDDKKIETSSKTVYNYANTKGNDLYLCSEVETVKKTEYVYTKTTGSTGSSVSYSWEKTNETTNTRTTRHTPVGNGWYTTSVTIDGDPQGSTLSQGKPGNKVSPYTINEVQKTFSNSIIAPDNPDGEDSDNNKKKLDYDDWRRRLAPIMDTSFPVVEFDILRELTDAIYWLNRKVQEDVTVELIDPISGGIPTINHIVDFTERVKFNGNEYFLVSNSIKFTPRKMTQKLHLVRWY